MLPLLGIVGAVGIGIIAGEYLIIGGSLGTGYGLGRKYGRKFCQSMDQVESKINTFVTSKLKD
jgi:hypothetical protein